MQPHAILEDFLEIKCIIHLVANCFGNSLRKGSSPLDPNDLGSPADFIPQYSIETVAIYLPSVVEMIPEKPVPERKMKFPMKLCFVNQQHVRKPLRRRKLLRPINGGNLDEPKGRGEENFRR